jgi:hypothetical protein
MTPSASAKLWPVPLALIVGAGLGVLFWRGAERSRAEPDSPPAIPAQPSSTVASGAPIASGADASPVGGATSVSEPPQPALLSGEAAQEAISDLSATYDAVSARPLARYLKHPDPEIRAAARDGLINLGERAAIPFLEEAAKTAPAEEAALLREAAEFLALPTWTEQREARKKAEAAGALAP